MRRLALIPIAAVLLAGCAGPEKPFIGTWNVTIPATSNQNPQAAQLMKQFAQGNTLQVNPDKSFVWIIMGQSAKGTFTLVDKTATFKVATLGGKDMSSPSTPADAWAMNGTVSDDGKTLTLKPTSGKGNGIAFTKAGS
jgi:hypothetical protein